MNPHTLFAVDPGASGGLAWQTPGSPVQAVPMPDTPGGVLALLREIVAQAGGPGNVTAYLEQVGGFIGRPQPGSAMFRFGEGYGMLHGLLLALGIRTERVTPQTWQRGLGIGTGAGLPRPEWKRKLRAEAERRFPTLKVTLATADALLLLDWAIRTPNAACALPYNERSLSDRVNTAELIPDRS